MLRAISPTSPLSPRLVISAVRFATTPPKKGTEAPKRISTAIPTAAKRFAWRALWGRCADGPHRLRRVGDHGLCLLPVQVGGLGAMGSPDHGLADSRIRSIHDSGPDSSPQATPQAG